MSVVCDRCDNFAPSAVTLLGGYVTELCTKCRRDWDDYVKAQPEYVQLSEVYARKEAYAVSNAGLGHSLDVAFQFIGYAEEERDLMAKIKNKAKEWIKVYRLGGNNAG